MINSKELLKYTQKLSLLLVEDHEELRVNTTQILKNFFNIVDSASNGEDALKLYKQAQANSNVYEIIITDIQMPKMNGVTLTEKIYDLNKDQVIIVLSAHDESHYLLPLINMGINQFIKKPIDYQELLNVLLNITKKNKTRNTNLQNTTELDFGDGFSYNRDTNLLLYNKGAVYLTKYEIIFLQQLTTRVGKIYSNEEIAIYFTNLDEIIDAQNIRKLVSKLRKKLPKNSLESIYGIGYRMILD